MIWTRVVLFLVFGVARSAAIVGGNLYLAYRLRPLLRPRSAEQQALERYRMVCSRASACWIGADLRRSSACSPASPAQSHWQTWLLFRNGGSFGIKDPQFGIDIGWYVFDYPFWRYLLGVGFTAMFLALLGALAVHYLFGGVRLQGDGDRMTTAARAQLTALVAAFVLLKAVAYFLDRRGTAARPQREHQPVRRRLHRRQRAAAGEGDPGLDLGHRRGRDPGLLQRVHPQPGLARHGARPARALRDRDRRHLPVRRADVPGQAERRGTRKPTYIQRSIDATRTAFGLTTSDTATYRGEQPDATGRRWPPTPTRCRTSGCSTRPWSPTRTPQLQQVRGFYDFGQKLDIDRYTTDGKTAGLRRRRPGDRLQQPAGAELELAERAHDLHPRVRLRRRAGQPDGLRRPAVLRLRLPRRPDRDQPVRPARPASRPPTSSRPRSAASTTARAWAPTRSSASRRARRRPSTTGPTARTPTQRYVTYTGKGGVSVGSYWRRMLYAYKYKEPNFLISSVFNSNSKILYVRDPRERVEKVAPFLTMDGDPYPAVVNGRITWILDGYTTASTYPYSDAGRSAYRDQ